MRVSDLCSASLRALPSALFCVLLLLLPQALQAQGAELLPNGNMETFTGNTPTSWNYNPNATGISSIRATNPSPFTEVFAAGGSSVMLTGATSSSQLLSHTIGAYAAPALDFSCEFQVTATGGSANGWELLFVDSTSRMTAAIFLSRNADQQRGGIFIDTFSTTLEIAPIVANTWYQLAFRLDQTSRIITGDVTPFGGSPVDFSVPLSNGSPSTYFEVRQQPYPFSFPTRSNLYLDNVSLTTSVPEPATAVAISLGVLVLATTRRRASEHARTVVADSRITGLRRLRN